MAVSGFRSWKDPALAFYLPFWNQIWIDPVFIITVRDPYDVAVSWRRFVSPPGKVFPSSLIDAYLLRWHYMMLLILEHTEGAPETIFTPYEGVVQDPHSHALRLGRLLNRCLGANALGGPSASRRCPGRSSLSFGGAGGRSRSRNAVRPRTSRRRYTGCSNARSEA